MGGAAGQLILRPLALGDVAHGDDQQPVVAIVKLGDRGFERNETAVLAIADDLVASTHPALALLAIDKRLEQFGVTLAEMGR
ncbi:hypothetical protein SDC9_170357 [bioreactor metagenome]|uniref:Uncharacterized protein n=1 Tax=bioreactor metagenome TaxID=1076179 RepID=A0A645GAG9_9ZZZZ